MANYLNSDKAAGPVARVLRDLLMSMAMKHHPRRVAARPGSADGRLFTCSFRSCQEST
jgi:hypothetical protein